MSQIFKFLMKIMNVFNLSMSENRSLVNLSRSDINYLLLPVESSFKQGLKYIYKFYSDCRYGYYSEILNVPFSPIIVCRSFIQCFYQTSPYHL